MRTLDYKSVRYPGHQALMKMLLEELQLDKDTETLKSIMRRAIPSTMQDVVLVFVTVSGLRGGSLVLTPLLGADNQIYAMAQGNLAVGGLGISAKDGSQLTVNIPTVGRIAEGASVERAVATGFESGDVVRFNLFNADFLTAARLRDVRLVLAPRGQAFAIAASGQSPLGPFDGAFGLAMAGAAAQEPAP